MPRIALLGGSFDPPHEGHLHLARALEKKLALTSLYFVPAWKNPLKDSQGASPDDRLALVEAAVGQEFHVLDWEIKKPGPSFTVDTLRRAVEKWPHVRPLFVVGNEAFQQFAEWKEPKKILELADLVVVGRVAGVGIADVLEKIGVPFTDDSPRFSHAHGDVIFFPLDVIPVSSTSLREALRNATQPPIHLPSSVWRVIKERGLYSVK